MDGCSPSPASHRHRIIQIIHGIMQARKSQRMGLLASLLLGVLAVGHAQTQVDVVVIGAGMAGLSAARQWVSIAGARWPLVLCAGASNADIPSQMPGPQGARMHSRLDIATNSVFAARCGPAGVPGLQGRGMQACSKRMAEHLPLHLTTGITFCAAPHEDP